MPISVGSAVFDTGASPTIVKMTKAKKEELNKNGVEPASIQVANGETIEGYLVGAFITLDGVDFDTSVYCSDQVSNSVFGLNHIQKCVVAMVSGRVSIAWCGASA